MLKNINQILTKFFCELDMDSGTVWLESGNSLAKVIIESHPVEPCAQSRAKVRL